MAPKVQGTRNYSINRVPPSFLSAKTLQHCKHTGLNQAYFTRPLIINTFFASLPGVNFIRKKARVCEVLRHYFTQCVCTGHTGVGHSLSIYILWTLGAKYHIFNRLLNLWDNYYNDTFEWYISCMARLRGVIYSRSVTVILEYMHVDLLRHIGSRVFAAKLCLSWLAMFYWY